MYADMIRPSVYKKQTPAITFSGRVRKTIAINDELRSRIVVAFKCKCVASSDQELQQQSRLDMATSIKKTVILLLCKILLLKYQNYMHTVYVSLIVCVCVCKVEYLLRQTHMSHCPTTFTLLHRKHIYSAEEARFLKHVSNRYLKIVFEY